MLRVYSWPGNVRELEHTIERAVALADDVTLSETDMVLSAANLHIPQESFQTAKDRAVALFEKGYLIDMLFAHQGNITKAAQAAGKNRRAFWQLLQKHGIDAHSVRASQHLPDLDKC